MAIHSTETGSDDPDAQAKGDADERARCAVIDEMVALTMQIFRTPVYLAYLHPRSSDHQLTARLEGVIAEMAHRLEGLERLAVAGERIAEVMEAREARGTRRHRVTEPEAAPVDELRLRRGSARTRA